MTGTLMMTAFGWNDSGGGTTVPRLAAKELVRRGWDVTVFHAAVQLTGTGIPYELREWTDDGVRLIGVHNRPHGLFDHGNPRRELDDPPITRAFAAALERTNPDVVHFHNLHNLGAALIDAAATRGLRSYFTTHNYWLICPRAYMFDRTLTICAGPGHGDRCAGCVGSDDVAGHELRLGDIRARAERGLAKILAVSEAVRETLLAAGYPPELVDVVRQAMPHEARIWEQVGRDRVPGRVPDRPLTVAFLGSAYPHKGPQLLVRAAQLTQAPVQIKILGEVPDRFATELERLDGRGVVELAGAFAPDAIGDLLRDVDVATLPSIWWDCAPLAAAECHAARVPLLVPRLGGLPEAIRDGVDGLSFEALSAEDLARQIDRLARAPGLLERLQRSIEAPRAFSDYIDALEAYYTDAGISAPSRAAAGAAAAPLSAPAVRWYGDHGQTTSLSIVNDQVARRLAGPVQRINRDGTSNDRPLPHPARVEVRHSWPPELSPPQAGALAAIVPWEFGAIPRDWATAIQANVDELWVPSEYVRQMYLSAEIDPDRVVVIPNGIDLGVFTPAGPHFTLAEADAPQPTRFLFVGGLIWRKGADLLLDAWRRAFAGRDDVELVIKDVGAGGVYRGADRSAFRDHALSGALPRIVLIEDEELDDAELAALYRACDVLVHPYRGEGFAMPVLEAMACGLPAIVTAGGPTDEFCPREAGWRIRSRIAHFPEERVDTLSTVGHPWVLEPDPNHLIELMRSAAADPVARRRRGEYAAVTATDFSWDAVAERYNARIAALSGPAGRRLKSASGTSVSPYPLTEPVALRLLATPAWRGSDQLGELLAQWALATNRETSACLYLLADPTVDGTPAEIETRVLAAAQETGADLDACADINVLMEPSRPDRDRRLHAAVDIYVPLHNACAGHARLAARVVSVASLGEHMATTPISAASMS